MPNTVNENFASSVSMTDFEQQSVYPLECASERFTALATLAAQKQFSIATSLPDLCKKETPQNTAVARHWQGVEILILEGSCNIDKKNITRGQYIRLPALEKNAITATTDCIFFIKCNQFLAGDTGTRSIETARAEKWLPGPVDGIEIRPLHVFDTESIMLLRWQHAAEFKPNLNPRGEEILVMDGLLQNRDHLYRKFSWIRNPIEDWRKWHGNTGTLIYYKSGHFPDDPIRNGQ